MADLRQLQHLLVTAARLSTSRNTMSRARARLDAETVQILIDTINCSDEERDDLYRAVSLVRENVVRMDENEYRGRPLPPAAPMTDDEIMEAAAWQQAKSGLYTLDVINWALQGGMKRVREARGRK